MNIQQFNFSCDVLEAILWQYNDSTNLVALMNDKQNWLNTYQSDFWYQISPPGGWYFDVFRLETANQFGLAVWSIILNLPLYERIILAEDPEAPIFGFNYFTAGPGTPYNSYHNFENSNFADRGSLILTVEQQRFLLRLRYFQLSTLTNIAVIPESGAPILGQNEILNTYSINGFLNYLCETSNIDYDGTIYVLDGLNMNIVYVFTGSIFPAVLFDAIRQTDVLPRPAGVGIRYFQAGKVANGFGFSPFGKNFYFSNFVE